MSSHGVPRSAAREFLADQLVDEKYRQLVDTIHDKILHKDYTTDAFHTSTVLLKKNPEYYTVWNFRRRILLHLLDQDAGSDSRPDDPPGRPDDQHSPAERLLLNDLAFLNPLMRQYPKCYWLWNYRRWVLQQIELKMSVSVAVQSWRHELGLVNNMLFLDERNFHGWAYRRIAVEALEQLAERDDTGVMPTSMAEDELKYTTEMIHRKLSNFSAWHHRSNLIPRVLRERNAGAEERKAMLEAELDLVQDALIDPNDQSLWFYHQYLMASLSPDCPDKWQIVTDLTDHDRARYYEQEVGRALDILADWGDSKWLYRALLRCGHDLRTFVPDHEPSFTDNDLRTWLAKLRELDPLRQRRWDDLEKTLGL